MSLHPEKLFTRRELDYLERNGYRIDRVYPSTGEALVYVKDRPYGFPVAVLKHWGNPPWYDRLRNAIVRWVA